MVFHEELEADAFNLLGHLRAMAGNLRKLAPEHWDWTYAPPAPTPRVIAVHTLAWLQCDRQHILNPDVTSHSLLPEASAEPEEICLALEREADEWEALLQRLTSEDLDSERKQFGHGPINVRGFVAHMVQNVIYKHGQFSTLYFALGYDGDAPYEAPFPNPIYKAVLGIS